MSDDLDTIRPSADKECCCCQTNDVLLHRFIHRRPLDELDEGTEHQHCDVCYSTLIGNTCTYPLNYGVQRDVARWIAGCTNIVLKALAVSAVVGPTGGDR